MRKPSNTQWYKGETEEESAKRHLEWTNKSEQTKAELLKLFPDIDMRIGQALWHCFVNKEVYLPNDTSDYSVGRSFRSWGSLLSELVLGTDYLDYYCNLADPELVESVRKTLIENGWVMEDM